MSVTVTTDIFCEGDNCFAWIHGATGNRVKSTEARNHAKTNGWGRIFVDNKYKWVDLCPECYGKHNY